ncbi:YjjG family noncanonical pyrimidine nucleotidase [Ammoniphilus sp. YIM 78166]|uniref:YjjG family noncanonical pyrimidine nucleotidase n=1 Tax=Ammoniphilus sp. YIM 78166 TaxID=1644106 RepID=UPI001070690F|nr:YjjG family noncanonical pyrimidine nucleotidase [Ammoniphilus sp. YIM 78166]
MKPYRSLLFDIDNTLLDFNATEKQALKRLFDNQNISLTVEMEEEYKKINHFLWRCFEEGKLSREEVVNTRFSLLFKEHGKEVDGMLLEKNYRTYLEEGHHLVQGALELVTSLQDHYELFIVTNGVSQTQFKRLEASGLLPLFREVFVSEDTGYQKPMKEFFDYVFARISNFSAGHALIIGDSLSADIKGGQLAGLDTCWFNPEGTPNHTAIEPTYQIQTLDELHSILNGSLTGKP